jgi:hypothetical protein
MKLGKWLAIVVLILALVVALLTARARAQETFVGSWVLDPTSSTAAPGMMPTGTVVEITEAGGYNPRRPSVSSM